MTISISIPEVAESEQALTFAGETYLLGLTFNSRDKRWRLSLSKGGIQIVSGVTLMENQSLLSRYLLDDFSHGGIYVLRLRNDSSPVGLDNLGIGKAYELVYVTNTELALLGV